MSKFPKTLKFYQYDWGTLGISTRFHGHLEKLELTPATPTRSGLITPRAKQETGKKEPRRMGLGGQVGRAAGESHCVRDKTIIVAEISRPSWIGHARRTSTKGAFGMRDHTWLSLFTGSLITYVSALWNLIRLAPSALGPLSRIVWFTGLVLARCTVLIEVPVFALY